MASVQDDDEMYALMEKRIRERQLELRTERAEKLRFYDDFVNNKLRKDLNNVVEQREKVYGELSQYLELKNSIERVSATRNMSTLVNLGQEFFIEAKVPDTSKVIVEVGLGFMVEFSHKEALDFIALKEATLDAKIEALSQDISSIKSHITLMLRGMEDLEGLEKEGTEDDDANDFDMSFQ